MAPLLRTTLAARGQTPAMPQRASQRDKVSVAAALWKTPGRDLVRLNYQTYPDQHVTNERYALFLEDLLLERLGGRRAMVVHDRGNMHRGEPLEALADQRYPWLLGLEPLPAYAPELNPVEQLWDFLKYDELPNFAPRDVAHLDGVLNDRLFALHRDQARLRTFIASSPLCW